MGVSERETERVRERERQREERKTEGEGKEREREPQETQKPQNKKPLSASDSIQIYKHECKYPSIEYAWE